MIIGGLDDKEFTCYIFKVNTSDSKPNVDYFPNNRNILSHRIENTYFSSKDKDDVIRKIAINFAEFLRIRVNEKIISQSSVNIYILTEFYKQKLDKSAVDLIIDLFEKEFSQISEVNPGEIRFHPITREQKGILTWAATNYVQGNFNKHKKTTGIFELSKDSLQIAFTSDIMHLPINSSLFRISNKNFKLYSFSYPNLGIDTVLSNTFDNILDKKDSDYSHPCLLDKAPFIFKNVSFYGTGSKENCSNVIKSAYLCENIHRINTSYYFFTTKTQKSDVCDLNYKDSYRLFGDKVNLTEVCFLSIYQPILVEEFNLVRNIQYLTSEMKRLITWHVGAAIGSFELPKQQKRSFLLFQISSFILGGVIGVLFAKIIACKYKDVHGDTEPLKPNEENENV